MMGRKQEKNLVAGYALGNDWIQSAFLSDTLPPLWLILSGLEDSLTNVEEFMRFPTFRDSMLKSHSILIGNGVSCIRSLSGGKGSEDVISRSTAFQVILLILYFYR